MAEEPMVKSITDNPYCIAYSPLILDVCEIAYPYISDSKDPWYEIYGGYHSGMDVVGPFAYALGYFHILYICENTPDDETVVIAQYNSRMCFRYSHLNGLYVNVNDYVEKSVPIGKCDKFCHIEYLDSVTESPWVVRVGSKQYYKNDPEPYVLGIVSLKD